RRLTREPIGFHVTIRLEDDRPIATTQAALRAVARVVLGQGEERGLLAFGTAADHGQFPSGALDMNAPLDLEVLPDAAAAALR
ncbi:MAG: hypothetical protein JWO86_8819, partial [Myxococcaceae bacterium]|nr:hypothetical protein [Myxococcaceae bacterium]